MAFSQGSLLLVGGGGEDYNDWSDVPYRWLVTHAPNARIIVLHYADTTNFFSGYFPWLSPCTVSNLAITTTAQANDSSVYRRILQYDGIFLRGGDQWQYVSKWRGTLAEKAIREVYTRGGVIGGTSAGEAILSEIVFDAHLSSVDPRVALRNPLGASITLTDDFLRLGSNFLADSHFFERGRLGRLPAFMAFYKKLKDREIAGIGVDYNTALGIGPAGAGEVMGAGTVTLLRYATGTQTTLAAGEPLSMDPISFNQLTAGSKVTLATGVIQEPPDAFPYAPVSFGSRTRMVILDGSNSNTDWSAPNGSLKQLQGALARPGDTIGIITSVANATSANAVSTTLTSWGVQSRILWISEAVKDDPAFAALLAGCHAFVFAGNAPDSLARFLDPATFAGTAFLAGMAASQPVAFLSDDVLLAGEQGISQLYRSIYGAYYGYLTAVKGVGVLRGFQGISRIYENSDYIDNRASALFWSMARSHLSVGVLLDNGAHVAIAGTVIHSYGSTPVLVVDARSASWGSLPSFRDPGKLNPRQNGGIINAMLRVLRDGDAAELGLPSGVKEDETGQVVPLRPILEQNYPNPFNPSTSIAYRVGGAESGVWGLGSRMVRLSVFDLLGREVAVLVNEMKAPGSYEVRWNATFHSSGVYIYKLTAGNYVESRRMILMR
jgi:cyanophycinase